MSTSTSVIDTAESVAVVSTDMNDLGIPGVQVEVDPIEAARLGAFESDPDETADAWQDSLINPTQGA